MTGPRNAWLRRLLHADAWPAWDAPSTHPVAVWSPRHGSRWAPAWAHPVEVIAARLAAVAVAVDADQSAVPAAGAAGALVGERRKIGLLDGRSGHRRLSTTTGPLRVARLPSDAGLCQDCAR
jgi:hypothetical protein